MNSEETNEKCEHAWKVDCYKCRFPAQCQAPAASNTGKPCNHPHPFSDSPECRTCLIAIVAELEKKNDALHHNFIESSKFTQEIIDGKDELIAALQEKLVASAEYCRGTVDVSMKLQEEHQSIVAQLQERNGELEKDLDETRDQMKTEKCDYCFEYDKKQEAYAEKLTSDFLKIADLEKHNTELERELDRVIMDNRDRLDINLASNVAIHRLKEEKTVLEKRNVSFKAAAIAKDILISKLEAKLKTAEEALAAEREEKASLQEYEERNLDKDSFSKA